MNAQTAIRTQIGDLIIQVAVQNETIETQAAQIRELEAQLEAQQREPEAG